MKSKLSIICKALLLCAILGAAGCGKAPKTSVNDNIKGVENNLIEASLMAYDINLMFDQARNHTLPKSNIIQRMNEYQIPGVSIALIRDYKMEWAKGYGVLDSGKGDPVTTETLFQAASTSKPLAAAIVLRLVEEGKLDLDTDVNQYLRSWKIPYDTIRSRVTLRLLITHKSGINRPGNGFDYEKGSSPTLVQVLNGEPPAINDPFRFDCLPGTRFQYSNSGYMIIQMVLEDVLQKSYKDIVTEYIFGPLKMESSLVEYPFKPDVYTKLSKPHDQAGVTQDYGLHPSALGCSGLVTTPADLAKFAIDIMLAQQGKSKKILKPESAQNMIIKTSDLDPAQSEGMTQYGFGFFLMGEPNKHYFVHPGGNNTGASCVLVCSATTGDGMIIMTNGLMGLILSMEIIASAGQVYHWHDIK